MARGRRRGDEIKAAFWRGMVREQLNSGVSIRVFCARRGLSEPGFHWWRRRLAGDRTPSTAGKRTPDKGSARPNTASVRRHAPRGTTAQTAAPATFAAVHLVAGGPIEIVLESGLRVLAPPGTNAVQLREVLETVLWLTPRPSVE